MLVTWKVLNIEKDKLAVARKRPPITQEFIGVNITKEGVGSEFGWEAVTTIAGPL